MNKKGQTLIAFVLLLPVILLFLAFTVDMGVILKEKTRLNSTLRTVLKTTSKEFKEADYQEKVKALLEKNNILIENVVLTKKENQVSITNEYEIDSIFGGIIGLKKYKIKTGYLMTIKGEEIIITKE